MLPDGGQDGPGSATDVMPAFARGHLGEADGSMSTPLLTHHPPSVQLAPCLIRHRGGGQEATRSVTCFLHTVTACLWGKTT